MPDENGKLSTPQQRIIEDRIKKCGILNRACPACNTMANWTLENKLVGLRFIKAENKQINQLNSGLPAVVLRCDGCGYLMAFHAQTVGIE